MKEVQDEIYQRIEIHPSNPSSSSIASVVTHHSSAKSNNKKATNANTSPNQAAANNINQRLFEIFSQLQILSKTRYNTK